MVMKILKGLGAAISPGVRRGGTRRGSGSRYYRRNKKDGTVSAVSEQTLAKRGAAAAGAGAGAAGAGATGAALASDDSESTRRRVDRRGRPLKSQTNGKNEAATEKSDNKRQTRRGMRSAPATTTPATKAKKDYSKKKADGGVTFGEAFNYYRNEKKQKTFTWDGKKYNTKLLEEAEASTGKTGTGKTGTGKTSTEETSATKKSAGKKGLDRFRSRKRAGGGMMKKKGFSQGGLSEKEPKVKKKKATGTSKGGKVTKTRLLAQDKKEVMRKRAEAMKGYAKGGMTKKGYAKGGMTKKGYAKGGSVRGKPRGVGAAVRGYGKALK